MHRLRLLHTKNAWRIFAFSFVLALVVAPRLPGAAVMTGDVMPALPWSFSTSSRIGITGVGTLTVDAGSRLVSAVSLLGTDSGSAGTATITGDGSNWENRYSLIVGNDGSGELHVEAGGMVYNASGYLAYNSGSTGMATITGAGSKWTSRSLIYVGHSGSGELRVEAGGEVSNTNDGYLGYISGSTGTATITGAGAKWTNSKELFVGNDGNGALRVEAGGLVSSRDGYLGYRSGSTGTVTISGTGSMWINNGVLTVGIDGSASLTVEDGGQVTTGTLFASLGDLHGNGSIAATVGAVLDADLQFSASHGAQAVLGFGAGGTLTVTAMSGNTLGAGYKGLGSLTISDGVVLSNAYGYLGYGPGSTGSATITEVGSEWSMSSWLDVGRSGSGALRVEAGGQVSSYYGNLGRNSGSTGTATITGASSKWTTSSWLDVGSSGSGALRVEEGGEVDSGAGYVGYNFGSTGTATITGAGSKWINSSVLQVGRNGNGALTITAGGLVTVAGTLTIDSNGGGDSFVNLATRGMLALWGDADDSLSQFLGMVAGTDAIRSWNAGLATWTPLTSATLGVDYTLQYQTAGDLTGYTVLTVFAPGPPGDFNGDAMVDGADLLAWQRGNSPTPHSPADLANWGENFGLGATRAVPEPATFVLAPVAMMHLSRRRKIY